MAFIGKLIGFSLGIKFGGFFGGLFGLYLGHLFDHHVIGYFIRQRQLKIQAPFLKSTFQVMGHIAKADGHVTEGSIAAAQMIMRKYAHTAEQRKDAIQHFQEGKQTDFNLDATLVHLRTICYGQKNVLRKFLEIQLSAAYTEGLLSIKKRNIIQHLCDVLHLGAPNFAIWDFVYGQMFHGNFQQQYSGQPGHRPSTASELKQSYAILEITPETEEADIKKAYRRLMKQHHPDTLHGLPPEMVKEANEKTQQIQKAYDTIKKSRGMN